MPKYIATILVALAVSAAVVVGYNTVQTQPVEDDFNEMVRSLIEEYVESSSFGGTQPFAGTTYNLAGSGISSSATTVTLKSLTIPQTGQKIQDSDLSDTFYITLEPGNKTRQEIVSCTTVTQNANSVDLTGCFRGLSPITPYTASTTLQFSHAGGSQVIFSDPPQLFNEFAAKQNDQQITGTWGFSKVPTTTDECTETTEFCTKDYIDNSVNQGAATSTESAGGIVILATEIQVASSTASTANEPYVIQAQNATSTPTYSCDASGTTGALCVPVGENDGKLSQLWLDLTESYTWTGTHIFDGSNTFANATTTGNFVLGTASWAAPTNTLTVDGTMLVTGHATTSQHLAAEEFLENGTSLIDKYEDVYATTTDINYLLENSGTETTGYTFTIPANSIGSSGSVRVEFTGTYTSTGGDGKWRVKLGGNTICTFSSTATETWFMSCNFYNKGASNQNGGMYMGFITDTLRDAGFGTDATVDTTANADLTITVDGSNAADDMSIDQVRVEVIKDNN